MQSQILVLLFFEFFAQKLGDLCGYRISTFQTLPGE